MPFERPSDADDDAAAHRHLPRLAPAFELPRVENTTAPPKGARRSRRCSSSRATSPLADDAAFEARSRWCIIEERTRDQSYKLDPARAAASALTGDPDIDALLLPHVRPTPIGAA